MKISNQIITINNREIKKRINIENINIEKKMEISFRLEDCKKGDIVEIRLYKKEKEDSILLKEFVHTIGLENYVIQDSFYIKNSNKKKDFSPNFLYLDKGKYFIEICSNKEDSFNIKIAKEFSIVSSFLKKVLWISLLAIFITMSFLFVDPSFRLENLENINKTMPEMNEQLIFPNKDSCANINLTNFYIEPIRLIIYDYTEGFIIKNKIFYKSEFIYPNKNLANDYLLTPLEKGNYKGYVVIEYLKDGSLYILDEWEIDIIVEE